MNGTWFYFLLLNRVNFVSRSSRLIFRLKIAFDFGCNEWPQVALVSVHSDQTIVSSVRPIYILTTKKTQANGQVAKK